MSTRRSLPGRVLHVSHTLNTGGAERVIAAYARFHDRGRYVPSVCSLNGGGTIAEEIASLGVNVHVNRKETGFDPRTLLFLARVIRSERPDLLHVHNPSPNNYAVPARLLSRPCPIVRTEHNIFYHGRVFPGYAPLNALLGLFNRRIIGVSSTVAASHRRKDFLNRGKYLVIHNGIDEEAKLLDREERGRLRKSLGIPPECPVVGVVAGIHRQKAIDRFLEAAASVLSTLPETRFLVVGDGVQRKEMESYASHLGLDGRALFLGRRADAPEIMQLMDVFVLSSLWEGFPITILEAMRAGRPVVVTDVGGNREAVTDGVTGYLVPPGSPGDMAARVLDLLRAPETAAAMGKAARSAFLEKFTARVMVKKTEDLYDQVLGLPRPPS